MFQRIAVLVTMLCLSAPAALAVQAKEAAAPKTPVLKAGDAAPALAIEKWVKGSPVAAFEKDKVYIVEFWATWCGPCIKSMPHLSALQKKYKDQGLTIIGVTTEDKNNSLELVQKMVTAKAEGMGYTVAFDKGSATKSAFRDAAGTSGIPCSFLIDKTGHVAYIGHPMYIDEPLAAVLAGNYDIEKGTAKIKALEEKVNAVFKLQESDPKAACAMLAEFDKTAPGVAAFFASTRLGMLLKAGDYDAASSIGNKLVEAAIEIKDAEALNEIAWTIVDPEAKIAKRDLELALKAALRANEFSGGNEPAILDTLARTYFCKGDVKQAIEIETKAAGLAKGAMKTDLEKSLAEFKSKNTQ